MQKTQIRIKLFFSFVTYLVTSLLISIFTLNSAYSITTTPDPYLITPNLTLSVNQVQTNIANITAGVTNIKAGVPVTFDLTKATIATGTIDYRFMIILSDLGMNPNLRPQDMNVKPTNKFVCRDESPRGTFHYNNTIPKPTSPYTCTFPVPGKYYFTVNLWGNVTSWAMYQGQKVQPTRYSGYYATTSYINVLPNPNKPTVLNKAPVARPNLPTVIELVPTSLKYPNGETVHNRATLSLDASASFDPDGSIVSYRWYIWAIVSNKNIPPGRGTLQNIAISQTSASPTASAVFSELGNYHAYFEVTDNKGARTEVHRIISVRAFQKNNPAPSLLFLDVNPLYIVPGKQITLSGGVTTGPFAKNHQFSYLKPKVTQSRCNSKGQKGTVIKGTASSVTHKFTAADSGLMDIFLTVTNTSGWTGSVCRRVSIR